MIASIKVNTMSILEPYERQVLEAFEKGKLKSVPSKSELEKIRAAAKATAKMLHDKLINQRSNKK